MVAPGGANPTDSRTRAGITGATENGTAATVGRAEPKRLEAAGLELRPDPEQPIENARPDGGCSQAADVRARAFVARAPLPV